jgi:hypothetical protein
MKYGIYDPRQRKVIGNIYYPPISHSTLVKLITGRLPPGQGGLTWYLLSSEFDKLVAATDPNQLEFSFMPSMIDEYVKTLEVYNPVDMSRIPM